MARLLHDRYLSGTDEHAWDLATGETIASAAIEALPSLSDPSLVPFVEVLEHGRDGRPRRLAVDAPHGRALVRYVHAVAEEARRRGFVPIAADVYLRLRETIADELRDRALVLIAKPSIAPDVAARAVVMAAVHSCRPHVLLVLSGRASHASTRSIFLVREARAVYGATASAAAPAPSSDVARHLERRARAEDYIRAGRHAAAERLLRDVAGALVRRRAGAAAAETYIMLGRLLLERGRAADADEGFGEAAVQSENVQAHALAVIARVWQAAARTDRGQLTAAESICRAFLLSSSNDETQRVRAEAALARVLLWQGRVEEAAELGCVRAGMSLSVDPFAEATAVRVLLESGATFEAGQRARALVTAVQRTDDPIALIIGLSAQLRVLLTTGDLTLAGDVLDSLRSAARRARSPLRLARAELLWVDALRRAGRDREATLVARRLDRVRRVAPPQLRDAIQRRLRGAAPKAPLEEGRRVSVTGAAESLVAIVQREDDDRIALTRLLEFVARAIVSSRLDLWSSAAGPATIVLSGGTSQTTRLGGRVLEAGILIGPESGDASHETCVPIRLGSRLVAAMAARWPSDVTPRVDAVDLMQLAAAVAAPRIESWLAAGREEARTAIAIPELVGTSEAMTAIRRAVVRAAASPFSILVDGGMHRQTGRVAGRTRVTRSCPFRRPEGTGGPRPARDAT